MNKRVQILKARVESELRNSILSFWIDRVVDKENGGFYGYISNDLKIDVQADKGCILNSRILWSYSNAYRIWKDGKYRALAERAYQFMLKHFWDKEYSGLFWMVDYKGHPVNTRKQIYNIAFGIYGLSEYYRAVGEKESLDRAVELFRLIEKYSYDSEYKGYFEALTREWEPCEDLRLSPKDMSEKKSMNTHLHVLEAYTNLFRVWKDDKLAAKLKELINVTVDHIIDRETGHFKLFFDEKWNSKAEIISYGHDIEGSWLLYEAAEVLGDEELMERTKEVAVQMADTTFKEGIDSENGGLFHELEENVHLDSDKHWWPQAEAAVGFLNAYQLTGKQYFLEAACRMWEFIDKFMIDKVNGEWFWKVSKDGKVYTDAPKVDPWKCPYHNSRACFEILNRLK